MNRKARNNVNGFLSLRRMVILSLVVSVGFHFLFTLAFFFGESLYDGTEQAPRPHMQRHQHPPRAKEAASDTLRFGEAQRRIAPMNPPHGFDGKDKPKKFRLGKMMLHTAFSFVLIFALFWYNRRIMGTFFMKKWREVFFVVLGSMLITTVLSMTFSLVIVALDPYSPGKRFAFRMIRDCLVRDYSLTTIVIMACFLLRSLYEQRIIAVENETLRTDNIRSHFEALKNQMDPHFLFNSLNTMQSLITVDPAMASDFVQQLSAVLRYTLQNNDVVRLADEMNCVRAYCDMMQIRYGSNLKFDFQIDPKYDGYLILPLSVQGLIENAIKHNVISAKQPLSVRVVTCEGCVLQVSNHIQPKIHVESESGIGLANLAERYRLKWEKEIDISDDGNVFVVTLPIINPNEER